MEAVECNNLGNILQDVASRFPDYRAIKTGATNSDLSAYSFADVRNAVVRLAETLRKRGVGKAHRVALLISNCPAFSISYFASLWVGAIVVPINPVLTSREFLKLLVDCQPELVIVEESLANRDESSIQELGFDWIQLPSNPIADRIETSESNLVEPVEVDANETAVMLYTSGTTGDPKGVELSHRNLYLNAKSVSEEKFSSQDKKNVLGPGDVGLAALPLSHAFGQTNFQNGLWFNGGCIVYQIRFDARETIQLMLEHQVTFFAGVPTMYVELNRAGRSQKLGDNKLKYCVCGGASLSNQVKQEFHQLYGVMIQESYGLSETAPMISCQKIDRCSVAGCVGPPIDGVEVRLVDEKGATVSSGAKGEIQVRGHNVFRRYFRNEAETSQAFVDGWFRTGDVGIQDENGELRIVDRIKEIIKSGGYTIYPREIENVLLEHELVEQAVVIGIPDQKYGETVKAFVKFSSPQAEATKGNPETMDQRVLAEIDSICKKNLASYKRPRILEIVNDFPVGSTGKIDRKKLGTDETLIHK